MLDPSAVEVEVLGDRLLVGGLVYVSIPQHTVQNDVAPGRRAFGVVEWVVCPRQVDDTGQHRRFRERQLLGALVVVGLCRGLRPVGVRPEVHRVQVLFQDLFFGVLLFVLPGQRRFGELTLEAGDGPFFLGYVRVLYELLGYRGAALLDREVLHVLPRGPAYGLEVQAPVLVEAVVLDGDHGLPERWIDLLHINHVAVLDAVQLVHDISLVVVHYRGLGEFSRRVVFEVRDLFGDLGVGVAEGRERAHQPEDRHGTQQQKESPENCQETFPLPLLAPPTTDPYEATTLHRGAIIQNI